MPILDKVRAAAATAQWERGGVCARAGGVSGGPDCFFVRVPGRADAFEVWLWEDDWSCSCEAEVKACLHVVAAAVAVSEGLVSGTVVRTRYRLRRAPDGLVLDRETPPGAARMAEDAELARIVSGWWGKSGMPKGLLVEALGPLRGLDVSLDGVPIRTDPTPVFPRVLVEDEGAGFKVRMVRAAGIDEAFKNGILRMGEILRPIGEPTLDPVFRQRLVAGITFTPEDGARLVTSFLPSLSAELSVEVRTGRLPRPIHVAPHIDWIIRSDGPRLAINGRVVYGDPPVAVVENGRMRLLDLRAVPVRDERAEGRLTAELHGNNVVGERVGAQAVRHLASLPAPLQREILARAPSFRLVAGVVEPSVSVTERDGALHVAVETGGVDPEALVEAWRQHEPLVPLMGGGWRAVPRAWLDQNAVLLAELLSARDDKGVVPRHAAPMLLDTLAGLDVALPPALEGLRALAGDFDAIPPARLPPGFTATLRTYQQRGVDWMVWLRSIGMGGLLADDMGLGKTVQTLGALAVTGGRHLVVAPTSVIRNWASEAARFWPAARVCVYHGAKRAMEEADITITSYALLRLDLELLRGVRWTTAVLDEAQAIKNPESQVAQAARALDAEHRLCLTGTPVENRLEELWSAFHFAAPGLLGGRREFRDRFSSPIESGDRRARDTLRRRIRPFVLRRLKQEVAPELPPRTDVVYRCQLSEAERATYETVRTLGRTEAKKLLDGGKGMLQILEVLLRMRQASCHTGLLPGSSSRSSAKLELLLETLDEIVEEGHKALVFSQWTSLLDLVEPALRERGWAWARLDGSTTDRAGEVARFSADDGPPVFLLSLKAGGTGINLTAADYVIHLDPWWNPAVEDQATDRAHRIGQTRPVVSVRLIAEDTVEERILALQERKRELAKAALDDDALARGLSRDELLELFD